MRKHYYTSKAKRLYVTNTIKELEFKYTISRARDTYGYNICSLWIHTDDGQEKVASSYGGGYDLEGVCLANWIESNFLFEDGLKAMKPGEFHVLSFYDVKAKKTRKHYHPGYIVSLTGKRGFSSMESILSALGFYLVPTERKANVQRYIIKSY